MSGLLLPPSARESVPIPVQIQVHIEPTGVIRLSLAHNGGLQVYSAMLLPEEAIQVAKIIHDAGMKARGIAGQPSPNGGVQLHP